jgi:hypothetical protein
VVVGGGLGSCAEFCIVRFTSCRGAFRCARVLFADISCVGGREGGRE